MTDRPKHNPEAWPVYGYVSLEAGSYSKGDVDNVWHIPAERDGVVP